MVLISYGLRVQGSLTAFLFLFDFGELKSWHSVSPYLNTVNVLGIYYRFIGLFWQ
jgi:hypothetical protein